MKIEDFNRQMIDRGWCVFEDFVPKNLIDRMLLDMTEAECRCRNIQMSNGLKNVEGTVHHLVGQGDSFVEYLKLFEDLNVFTEEYFGGKYILNAFGGNSLSKDSSYASDIHRDIRSFSGSLPLMLNTIVMLDDFTMSNGATWLMHRGHLFPDKPAEKEFDRHASQVIGKAGSVVFFNSNLWHRAGKNMTDSPRRSITPMFVRPFCKQQFDYTKFCYDNSSAWMKQILGWNSRTPATLSDWYQLPERRFYKVGQG